ncbi:MAG TPA: sugar ABC transporter permease [Spirochaetia bacterium]|nr:sugar ABC transporter permease [Spirochaetia bacterium]
MKSRRRSWIGLLFLLPAFLVFGLFQWYPIVNNFILAFQEYTPGMDPTWIGLANYQAVLGDDRLWQALQNTFSYVAICLVIGFAFPIAVAIAISLLRRGKGFFRLAIYVPNIIPAIATYIIWGWIFNPQFGLLNQIGGWFGAEPIQWLVDKNLVLVSLAFMATWAGFGSTAVLYMASLTAISPEMYEAAEIEGAGIWQRIRYITLPSLMPTISLMLILQLLATFQILQEPFVMTSGGPNDASLSVMLLSYQYAFNNVEFGKAGALGSLLFLLLMGLSFYYVRKSGLAEKKGA